MSKIDKVIVSHHGALRHKYGTSGLRRISTAVRKLIRADEARGLHTQLVFLDDPDDMSEIGRPLDNAIDRPKTKRAIDDVFHAIEPDYLLILGGPDVIPHLRLKNPMAVSRDSDRWIDSDLPYACDAPYATAIRKFLGPTRVVGRLPDVTGKRDPSYLVRLLAIASEWKSRPRSAYGALFALSTQSWKKSTNTSARKISGKDAVVRISPSDGPSWTDEDLAGRLHFINCHGDKRQPEFYGESEDDEYDQPISHLATRLSERVSPATVVAAECCYGAQLYAPKPHKPMGICNTYLEQGAWAFFGSTTVAYGPAEGNNFADLMCVKFLQSILEGASVGRAALLAQQHYVAIGGYMEMIDLKTLAQFVLLGDPSIHPVRSQAAPKLAPAPRRLRRRRMASKGTRLSVTTASVDSRPDAKLSRKMRRILDAHVTEKLGAADAETAKKIVSFRLHAPPERVQAKKGRRLVEGNASFHAVVLKGKRGRQSSVKPLRIMMIREVNGKIDEKATAIAIRHSLSAFPL